VYARESEAPLFRIKELAQARGYENPNQLALAARLTYPQTKRYWLNKVTKVDTESLAKIATALDVPVWALYVDAPLAVDSSTPARVT